MDEVTKRFGEASSWAGLAAAAWGATVLLPGWLAPAFGLDDPAWRAVGVALAIAASVLAIALPERGR
jgi:hypothetical protein